MTDDRRRRAEAGPITGYGLPTATSARPWDTGGNGPILRNKANSSRAIRRTRILWKKGYDKLGAQKTSAKQSQFPPSRHGPGPAGLPLPQVGPVAPDKANLPRAGWRRRGPLGPEALMPLGTSVRNKANSRADRCGTGPARLPVPPTGLSVRNKANCPAAIRRASVLQKKGYDRLGEQKTLAKQSQFLPRRAWAKPAWPPVPPVGPVAPNKANLPRTGRNRRGPAGPEVLPLLGASVRNKANSRQHPARPDHTTPAIGFPATPGNFAALAGIRVNGYSTDCQIRNSGWQPQGRRSWFVVCS